MVGGGGSDGSLDLCARVCLIDEYESIIFRTYVKPPTPATNYRHIWIRLHQASPDFNPYIYLPTTNKTVVHIFWISNGFSMVKSGYQTTGIQAEYLREALPLSQAQRKIQDLLYNREPMRKLRPTDGKASILVGHILDRDLSLLQINYPATMMR
nr:hypothetical protein CFP56_40557 [Quercus suber]